MSKVLEHRVHNVIYDPFFVATESKDYTSRKNTRLTACDYKICPNFQNMFSDLDRLPNKIFVLRKPFTPPSYRGRFRRPSISSRLIDVRGKDRHRFCYHSLNASSITSVEQPKKFFFNPIHHHRKSRCTQTLYRESSAQTHPWQPPWKLRKDSSEPEILRLSFLKWGRGLPPGRHEVLLIERARMKLAWQKQLQLAADNVEDQQDIVEAIEVDEWAFREQEMQDIEDLRMSLLKEMLKQLHSDTKIRNEIKINMYAEQRYHQKDENIKKIRNKITRELRKLDMQAKGINPKYHHVNIVTEHTMASSELFMPLMRHGEHPKRFDLLIDETLRKYKEKYENAENMTTIPANVKSSLQMKDCCCKNLKGTRLCIRETKWKTDVLRRLHMELKELGHVQVKKECHLRILREKPLEECGTPEIEGVSEFSEKQFQAVIVLQSVIKGRASQIITCESRDTFSELIHDIKYSVGLLLEEKAKIRQRKLEVESEQKQKWLEYDKEMDLFKNFNKMQSNFIGCLLDFLTKELLRLHEERLLHALCLLIERERYNREAEEAGRRQKELRRRREHDEIFKQIAKIHHDSADMYLDDIIKEGLELTSTDEAQKYIKDLADKIDQETSQMDDSILQEEYIASLVHNFVLPEVEKTLVRDAIKRKQLHNLQTVNDDIYTETENLLLD